MFWLGFLVIISVIALGLLFYGLSQCKWIGEIPAQIITGILGIALVIFAIIAFSPYRPEPQTDEGFQEAIFEAYSAGYFAGIEESYLDEHSQYANASDYGVEYYEKYYGFSKD